MAKAVWIAQHTGAGLIRTILPVRARNSHKGDYGRVLLLCGSTGLSGAAALAAKAFPPHGTGPGKGFWMPCGAFSAWNRHSLCTRRFGVFSPGSHFVRKCFIWLL